MVVRLKKRLFGRILTRSTEGAFRSDVLASPAHVGNLGTLVLTTDQHNPATYVRQAPRLLAVAAVPIFAPHPHLWISRNTGGHKLARSNVTTPAGAFVNLPSSIPPLIGTPASRAPLRGMARGSAPGRNGRPVFPQMLVHALTVRWQFAEFPLPFLDGGRNL